MTTDYINPSVDIDGRDFDNAMCSGYPYKILATHCAEHDFSCRTSLMGTGKGFVLNCYEIQNLFICYIHFLTNNNYYFVQVQVI